MTFFLSACGTIGSGQNSPQTAQNPLPIPELIDSRITPDIELVMQKGEHEFYAGAFVKG
jgi:hypothetical protein